MRKIQIWILLIGASLIVLWPGAALAGGGGGGRGGGPCAGFASGATLVLRDSCFDGVAHFVDAGGTLVVRNEGQVPHSFTAVDGSFDTGILNHGETAEIRVQAAGIFRAYCTLHSTAQGGGMAGVLIIGDPTSKAAGAAGLIPAGATALGIVGVVLGGAALAVVLRRQPPVGPTGG